MSNAAIPFEFLLVFFFSSFLILVWFYLTQILSGLKRKAEKKEKSQRLLLFVCLPSGVARDSSLFYFLVAATSPLSDELISRRR